MKRLLYLSPGPVPPSKNKELIKFFHLGNELEGDVLEPVWWDSKDRGIQHFGEGNFPDYKVGNFIYHLFLIDAYPAFIKPFARLFFYIFKGLSLVAKNGRYDYIMSYGSNSTGLAALVLKLITGGKFILEIPGVPEDGGLYDNSAISLSQRIRHAMANMFLHIVGRGADHTKLLYLEQLQKYPGARQIPASVFHDFVPTNEIEKEEVSDQGYAIFLGYPWYRKGIDVLIKSFRAFLDQEASDCKFSLKIVGWFPDRAYLDTLIGTESERIKILKPVQPAEAFRLIANSSFLILPSRSEAMGRVVLEAMAAKKPVIGSNVNGIPTYVTNNETGLLFKSEDILELTRCIQQLYRDHDKRKLLGEAAYLKLKSAFDDKAYVREFHRMLKVIGDE